jgi:peptide-O-fucosyltransferase
MAVFVKKLRQTKGFQHTKLVLPTFPHLYHWKSRFRQSQIFWNKFFDLPSLKLYTEVIDLWEFFEEVKDLVNSKGLLVINDVFKLQHFDSMFENGVFEDKFEETACRRSEYDNINYFEYYNITENRLKCLNFQGSAGLLYKVLRKYVVPRKSDKPKIVMFQNAEIVLHDSFGDAEYWMARRSMRFNENFVQIANDYRRDYFRSNDQDDLVQRPAHWVDEKV